MRDDHKVLAIDTLFIVLNSLTIPWCNLCCKELHKELYDTCVHVCVSVFSPG